MRARGGFSLVEALLACALLTLALVPVLSAFRAQLAAADRLALRQRVDARLEERLARAELRLLAGDPAVAPSGLEDGLAVFEAPPERTARGAWSLWRLHVRVRHPGAAFERADARWLLLPPPPEEPAP